MRLSAKNTERKGKRLGHLEIDKRMSLQKTQIWSDVWANRFRLMHRVAQGCAVACGAPWTSPSQTSRAQHVQGASLHAHRLQQSHDADFIGLAFSERSSRYLRTGPAFCCSCFFSSFFFFSFFSFFFFSVFGGDCRSLLCAICDTWLRACTTKTGDVIPESDWSDEWCKDGPVVYPANAFDSRLRGD